MKHILTIEGGNRHDATLTIFMIQRKKNRKDKHVNYCIIKSVDRETMQMICIVINLMVNKSDKNKKLVFWYNF